MKKKVLGFLLCFCLMAGMMSGCGEDSGSASDDTEQTEDVGMAPGSGEAADKTEVQPEEVEPAVYYLAKEAGYAENLYAVLYADDADLSVDYEREYDASGNLISESHFEDLGGEVWTFRTEYEYDAAGNLLFEKNSTIVMYGDEESVDTSTKEYEYDAAGNLISITDSYSAYPQTFEYDAAGKLVRVVDGSPSRWTEYQYDETGNLVKEIKHADDDEDLAKFDGIDQINEYDASGNLIKQIINNIGFSGSHGGRYLLEQEFDVAGNLIKWDEYRDGSEQVTSSREYEYDEEGRIIKEAYISYTDDNGKFYDEPLSRTYTYSYDEEGRIKETHINYADDNGNFHDSTSTYSYEEEYDESGNLIRFIMNTNDYVDHWTKYEYDEAGNLISETTYYGDDDSRAANRIEYEYAVQ